jgi:hypothetical protein
VSGVLGWINHWTSNTVRCCIPLSLLLYHDQPTIKFKIENHVRCSFLAAFVCPSHYRSHLTAHCRGEMSVRCSASREFSSPLLQHFSVGTVKLRYPMTIARYRSATCSQAEQNYDQLTSGVHTDKRKMGPRNHWTTRCRHPT